jgi:hypothetical protein
MNAKKSIINKTFIKFLENILIKSTQDFEAFDTSLWQFLCGLKWHEKVRLTNQLSKPFEIKSKVNIGNLRLQIYNDLNINFMLE